MLNSEEKKNVKIKIKKKTEIAKNVSYTENKYI